jgi:hypothetical protein
MAEGFELVRTIRQHLRRGATLLDEGHLHDALAEANAALALDPQSLPAQALRDRIERSRSAHALPHAPQSTPKSTSFVPHGVNAASWRGFEQRITERRFRALLETVNTSIVAGDAAAARVALDEARELRPDAPELDAFEARVAAVPVHPPVETPSSARIWMRAMSAAALFLVGVSMFIGLELMRPSQNTIAPVAMTTPTPPAAPQQDLRYADVPAADPVPVPMDADDDSVPAIIMPPEPTLRPRGTTATTPIPPASEPVARRETAPPPAVPRTETPAPTPAAVTASARPIDVRPLGEDAPIRPVGEVSDEYVADVAVRTAANDNVQDTPRTADVARAPIQQQRVAPPPAPAMTSNATAASVVPAAALTTPGDTSRVEEVLRRYARAYDSLDASAARAVWPSVNEKALARAFQDLSSQNVSFDNCDIDIRGAVANASCSGEASYVVKVGSREPRTEPRLWRFELRRDGEAWKIENAETRRQATSTSYRD